MYKIDDIPAESTQVQTFFQFAGSHQQESVYEVGFQDLLTAIPGMSFVTPPSGWASSSFGNATAFTPHTSMAYAPSHDSVATEAIPDMNKPLPEHDDKVASQLVNQGPVINQATVYPSPSNDTAVPGTVSQPDVGPFRMSAWELEPELAAATSQMPLRTSIFKK